MVKRNAVPEHVGYEEAKLRIIKWGADKESVPINWFADAVWPGHRMTAQGAALAVSPIIKRMREEGLIVGNYRALYTVTQK